MYHQIRYNPYGSRNWGSGTAPTDYDFTGQRLDGFGLLDYHARYYDAVIGRFISPDSVIPDYTNPQDLNRYSYVRGNPVRFNDPSGHFLNDDLKYWFGTEDWQNLFGKEWADLLLEAEFGDAMFYGYDANNKPQFAVFVQNNDGALLGWDVSSKTAEEIPSLYAQSNSSPALFRPETANRQGGASDNPEYYSSHFILMPHYTYAQSSVNLPNWHVGVGNTHVEITGGPVGIDLGFSDVLGLSWEAGGALIAGYAARKAGLWGASRAAAIEFGGYAGFALLAVDLADWAVWDTDYRVAEGRGYPDPSPVPTPSRR